MDWGNWVQHQRVGGLDLDFGFVRVGEGAGAVELFQAVGEASGVKSEW